MNWEAEMQKICTWEEDEDGLWNTECNNVFEIIDGTPEENKMKYCPYCGRILCQILFYEEEEE